MKESASRCTGVVLMLLLPLAGLAVARKPLASYLQFPPTGRYVFHAGFSWPVFLGLAALALLVVGPFIWRVVVSRDYRCDAPHSTLDTRSFPPWGWAGLALGVAAWVLAWTRFEWFRPLQLFTFTPLWLSYVIVVNALTQWRSGRCLLSQSPLYVAKLFLLSAAFWWFFEFLNRFVQNWVYVGIGGLSAWQYFLFATLPFSTVLPAVLSTRELLDTFPSLTEGLDRFIPLRISCPRTAAVAALLIALAGLAGLGVWPNALFPLLWLAPLLFVTGLQALRGEPTVFAGVERGDWRGVVSPALAALVCGFFWEMWNYMSLAKWIYAVPYVNRFHVFEMPILGYSGYLPFGLECVAVAQLFLERRVLGVECRGQNEDAASSSTRHSTPDTHEAAPFAPDRFCFFINALLLASIALYFFLAPAILLIKPMRDPAWKTGAIPEIAWKLHRDLSPKYAPWARTRQASGIAAHLPLHDVPSTEWPIFGSVFYLWSTERLQEEWQRDPSRSAEAPATYARNAIEAATDLILDPVHHTWVRTHWGENYMHRENVFFRSLIIAGITAHENLVHDGRHLDLLRDQVESLAAELDASPHGVLNDYPEECYPIDVLAAVACIRRADRVLGTDHSAFAARERRAFEGAMLDGSGLPPYSVDPISGLALRPSQAIGNSWVLVFARELWPDIGDEWYRRYEDCFWQDRGWAAGFREFARGGAGGDWGYDIDAGPIIAGFSPAGNAFGLAAARVNGRLDHARTLALQVLAATWPLPDGTLLGARLLSNQVHAPYLGEACLLFMFTQKPLPDVPIRAGGRIPGCVAIGFVFYVGIGLLLLWVAWRWFSRAWKRHVSVTKLGFGAWLLALALMAAAFVLGWTVWGCLLLFMACWMPGLRLA